MADASNLFPNIAFVDVIATVDVLTNGQVQNLHPQSKLQDCVDKSCN